MEQAFKPGNHLGVEVSAGIELPIITKKGVDHFEIDACVKQITACSFLHLNKEETAPQQEQSLSFLPTQDA